jgi:hypothetical protein
LRVPTGRRKGLEIGRVMPVLSIAVSADPPGLGTLDNLPRLRRVL